MKTHLDILRAALDDRALGKTYIEAQMDIPSLKVDELRNVIWLYLRNAGMGWQSMETAPAGKYRTVKGVKGERQVFVPEWCFVMQDGQMYWTYRTEAGRWNGFTETQIGDCWHPAPSAPVSDGGEG